MTDKSTSYRRLDSGKIIETIRHLHERIEKRFPASGLGKVVGELLQVSEETVERTYWIQKPHLPLRAIHELRALAHIIDMHQLTKDPESYFGKARFTTARKLRPMSPFELNRYLDYCSDAMGLISKVAALYVQSYQDPVLLDAVD